MNEKAVFFLSGAGKKKTALKSNEWMACELFRGKKKTHTKKSTLIWTKIGKIENKNSNKNRSPISAFRFYFSLFHINFIFGAYVVCCIGLIFIPESHMLNFFELQIMVPATSE